MLLLAYPLYVQFFGPDAYSGLSRLIRGYSSDLASFVAYSRESLAGSARTAAGLAKNPTEENSFFGWALVVLVIALVWWLRRSIVVLALAALGLLFAVLSLGREVRFDNRGTGVPGPWAALENLPILHSVVPTRWALAITPIIGLLLAYGAERARELAGAHPAARGQVRFVTATVLTMALLPIVPTPLPVARLDPVPSFVTSGAWRPYVTGGRSVVTLPLPDTHLRRAAALVRGDPAGHAAGPWLLPRPGHPPERRSAEGRAVRCDSPPHQQLLRHHPAHRGGAADHRRRAGSERSTTCATGGPGWSSSGHTSTRPRCAGAMTELTGIQPVFTGGVWVWDVRSLTD